MKNIIKWGKNSNFISTLAVLVVTIIVTSLGFSVMQGQAFSYLRPNDLRVEGTAVITGGALIASDGPVNGLIVQTGNVGIGTGSPSAKLNLYGTSGELVLRMQNGAAGGRNWELNSKNGSGSLSIIDRTASADRLIITSNGNVGIGLTNPSYRLHVEGGAYVTGKSYMAGGLDIYNGGLNVLWGNAYFDGDVTAPGNRWGTCTFIQKTLSCTSGWALLCDEGQFMRGIHNNGGSNTCFDAIYCCDL